MVNHRFPKLIKAFGATVSEAKENKTCATGRQIAARHRLN
jgi:hypothetical protein